MAEPTAEDKMDQVLTRVLVCVGAFGAVMIAAFVYGVVTG